MPLPPKVACPTSEQSEVFRTDVAKIADCKPTEVVLLDVREKSERKGGKYIPHSRHIPLADIESAFAMHAEDFEETYGFPKPTLSTPIIVSCGVGLRAKQAFNFLEKIGYTHVKCYKGGYAEWSMPPLERLRKRTMVPFGKATASDNANAVAIENSAAISLGKVDPIEKAAVDEITTLMQASQTINVVSPTAKRLNARKAEEAAKEKAEKAAAAAAVTSSPDAPKKEGLSWAEAKKLKAQSQEAAGGARPGRDTSAAVDKDGKPVKRTSSGNQIDPLVVRVRNLADVTAPELQRLFGPDNDLGQIARMYVAPPEKGMAYITYKNEADASKAIQKMNGRRFKFLILAVDHGTVVQKRKR